MSQDFDHELTDDLRDEYDFAKMQGGVRGKYVKDYRKGTNFVLLVHKMYNTYWIGVLKHHIV